MLNHYYYLSPPYQRPTNHHTPNNPQPLKQEALPTKTKSLEEYSSRLRKSAVTYSPTTRSTIGDAELNDPVRNGKGWDLSAITTLIIL